MSDRPEKGPLKLSEEYFRALIENSLELIIVVDIKGTIAYVSPSIERLGGYKPDELIGKSTFDFIMPADLPRAIYDFGRAVLAKEGVILNSFRVRHKDGSERILEGVGKNLLGEPAVRGFVMNVRDVTDRKRAEEALKIAEERFFKIFISSPNAIFISTLKDGRIIDLNESAAKTFGWQRKEMVGRSADELNLWANSGDRKTMLSILQEKGTVRDLEADFRRKSGEIFKGSISVDLIEINGEKVILTTGNNITGRKRAEEELKKKFEEVGKLNNFLVDRETRVLEVKEEVNRLLKELGREPKYKA